MRAVADTLHPRSVPVPIGPGGWFDASFAARHARRGGRILGRMHDPRLLETTIASRVILTGRYLTVRVDTIRDADGGEHTREIVDHPGAVAILAIHRGSVLMVHQYRTPPGRVLLEIPAGTLEREPDGTTEDPMLAAPRELGEETGHAAATWHHLGSFYTAPGFSNEYMHLYLATDLSPIEGYTGPDVDERLSLERVPWREAVGRGLRGEIVDAKSLLALLWLERMVTGGELVIEDD
jgi:ADP-ribose pyrophosphatase